MLRTLGQFLLVLVMTCIWHVAMCSFNGNDTDKLSLLEFKKAISDPQQALVSWNDSTHFCHWEGIMCSVKHPHRVTSLRLKNQGLAGKISPSLGNLTFIKILILSANSFSGEIPPSLSYLHRLQNLNLINNTLLGTIPSFSNSSKLKELWLENNQLDGQIPADLPSGLQKLILGSNNLSGTIPASLANISTLNLFTCFNNNIEGNIPNEFAKLKGLQQLYVGKNNLSGRFPQVILNISSLVGFSVVFNGLSGNVPSNLGDSLPNLQLFELGGNFFHGHIPSGLTNASNLELIDISINEFSGVLPRSIGKLSKLSWLNVENNDLQARNQKDWEFMDSLVNCTGLEMFSVVVNRLEGIVPKSLGNLSNKLQYLQMGGNQLSGAFPPNVGNLHNLVIVSLNSNQFTGELPEWLGTLKSLQELVLDNNVFTGLIPSCLSNLSNLVRLTLNSNQFYGHIPPSLGNLQMLGVLNIYRNNLHGSIPKEIFGIPTMVHLSLSFNKLDSPIHTDIGNAKQLIYFNIASNNISGEIPSTLGNCESLEDIKMGYNKFTGNIPTSLGSISGLQLLNLSHNNLSGSIPESLGSLRFLEQLDLSFNHLDGEVPMKGIFGNVSSIRIDGNQGLCGGPLDLHLLACPVMPLNSKRHKHSTVKNVVIPLVAIVSSVAVVISVVLLCRGKQKRNSIFQPSLGTNFPKVSYHDIARATKGFSTSNLLAKGRYSSVYVGKLFQDRIEVAIKVFSLETRGAQKSFIAECNSLKTLRHRNLVRIITACSSIDSNGNDFKALVYELMPRGDLHTVLYTNQDDGDASVPSCITLAQRLCIVVNIADALEYLHHNNQGTIVHCDLKPSNILLDENMTAHIGDFGLARFKVDSSASYFSDSISTSSIAIKGTIGYVAPECATGRDVSSAGDVYSFGIIVLEIFLRKRPTDDMFKDGLNIARFVEMNFPDRISKIVDPELLEELQDLSQQTSVVMKVDSLECLRSVLSIGLQCANSSPNERMDMQEVAARLRGIKQAYLKETEAVVDAK